MNWVDLKDISLFSDYLQKTLTELGFQFAVFKHSTRCSISHAAHSRMERQWQEHYPDIPVLYLDLLGNRNLSNEIAQISGVSHESPQLLVFRSGKCVFNASHYDVQPSRIQW